MWVSVVGVLEWYWGGIDRMGVEFEWYRIVRDVAEWLGKEWSSVEWLRSLFIYLFFLYGSRLGVSKYTTSEGRCLSSC